MLFKATEAKYQPNATLERALEVLFILHADHEQNCSTNAVRAVGSSQVDPYCAVAAGVAALYGPLHGGANEEVLRMLAEIGSKDRIPAFIKGVKDGKAKLMGFGHRVYKNYDPRAKIIKRMADEVFEVTRPSPLLPVALELERIALEDDYFVSRKLYPNVDFYSGLIYQAMGFPVEMFPVLFAIARTSGWLAQWQEMRADPRAEDRPPAPALPGIREARLPRYGQARGSAGAQGMNASLRFDRAPRRVYWEVTRACDLACRHCRAEAVPERDPAELDAAAAGRLLIALEGFGAPLPHLILTGGDPLKRGDLFALIDIAQSLGFEVSVAPSGTPLLTTDVIGRLSQASVAAISLSLDGSTAARHDGLRRVPGCFDRTLEATGTCRAAGLPFQVNTLVSEETLDDLPAIHRLATGVGAARWSLFFLVAVGRGTMLKPITAEACERLFERLLDLGGNGGDAKNTNAGPIITTTEAPHFRRVVLERARRAGRGQAAAPRGTMGHGAGIRDGNGIMFISHTGEVHPSGFLPLSAGNARTADPVALYRDSDLFRTLRRPELLTGRCGRCEYAETCGGSRARAFAATGDPMAEDPLCLYESARNAG